MSRKDVVLAVSNKDGGAHIDPEFDEAYANISKRNSLGIYITGNDKQSSNPANNPIYASIRQIACEILSSIELLNLAFQKIINSTRSFEVRYVDENKRFKWSTTDIQASEKTKLIINQFEKKERIYNIHKYVNGATIEVIRND